MIGSNSPTPLEGQALRDLRRQADRLLDRVRRHDWIVPSTMVLLAVILAFSLDALDEVVDGRLKPMWWLFSGGQTTARQLLSAIAAAMVAIVTMAFSVTVTALIFIAQHYGTRIIRTFMRNLTTQIVMGAFLATFVYALLVLRSVHGASTDEALPRIAVTIGIVLALVSFGLLIFFLYHISESLDGPNIVAAIANDLEQVISRMRVPPRAYDFDVPTCPAHEASRKHIESTTTGYLQEVNHDALAAIAQEHEAFIRLHCRIGRFIISGDCLATVQGKGADRVPERSVRKALRIGVKRTLEQDVEFGLDQLVQAAIRGLSPGRNDTFTTMLCLDRLGACLSLLAQRPFPSAVVHDDRGQPRLLMQPTTFPELVDRAFGQIHSFGGETTVVAIRLLRTIHAVAVRVRRPDDGAALRLHAVAVHDESRKHLSDRVGVEAVEEAFRDVLAILDRRSPDTSRDAAFR